MKLFYVGSEASSCRIENKVIDMEYYSSEAILEQADPSQLIPFFSKKLLAKNESAQVPLRTIQVKDNPFSVFGTMPVLDEQVGLYVVKNAALVCGSEGATINAIVTAFCTHTGKIIAQFEGNSVTAVRTAATSASITSACVSATASSLAVIGAGVQAWYQVNAMLKIRAISKVSIYSRGSEKADKLKQRLALSYPELEVEVYQSVEECLHDKDIIVSATTSKEPIFDLSMVKNGAHVNLIGAHSATSRELSHEDLSSAKLITEDIQFASIEAGDIHQRAIEPHDLTSIDKEHLINNKTVFSSVGTALLDLYCIEFLLAKFK